MKQNQVDETALAWQLNLVSFKSPEDIYGLEVLSPMNALVFLRFLFHFCRLDNLLVSARMFPDSVIFWCQAALQNTVAEQSNPSSQSSCKNQGIIRGLEP
ncbi:hypothetical protein RHGRI_038477 [Rhododendron griersonianum]|uniref:Uncharacterized protein n=1 Tax=Rhododendron griersonianum TaxID=479676 RepID=A0AAV6HPB0_9ERIC|nr:hypothetical protein RHGRI_038477 [Rhododendron griersonianum]